MDVSMHTGITCVFSVTYSVRYPFSRYLVSICYVYTAVLLVYLNAQSVFQ